MLFSIENGSINSVIGFLGEVSLTGRASRGRTKLLQLLEPKIKDLGEFQEELVNKYVQVDEGGNPKMIEDGSDLLYKDEESAVQYIGEFMELVSDVSSIDVSEYQPEMKSLLNGLLDYNGELSGQRAAIYDLICSKLEELGLE